MTAAICELT